MAAWPQFSYTYDGSFAGFLTCVYESYTRREYPACFILASDPRLSLWPDRWIETSRESAERVYRSLSQRISRQGQRLVSRGFLTCLPEKEARLYAFIRLGYRAGPAALRDLTDPRIYPLTSAVRQLENEAHQLKGFLRFSEQGGLLCASIEPKNRVLPLLRPHFCTRYSGESFVICDAAHQEALFYRPGSWCIAPLEEFHMAPPGQEELDFRRLWRQFYDTVAIEGRYNPRCRMTHMPKRYWAHMTEFQAEDGQPSPAAGLPARGG